MHPSPYTDWKALLGALSVPPQPFASAEDQYILSLLKASPAAMPAELNWQRLELAHFAHPYIHSAGATTPGAAQPPQNLRSTLRGSHRDNFLVNTHRIQLIQTLSKVFSDAGLKVVLLKGASEIARFANDGGYLARRFMGDVDFLCAAEDLQNVDALLLNNGYEFYDYGFTAPNQAVARALILRRFGAYQYDATKKSCLEMHFDIGVGDNAASYPPGFAQRVYEQSEQVELHGTAVWVPKREHQLVYLICHAASIVNHRELIEFAENYLDEFAQVDWHSDPWKAVNGRLDAYQESFLLKLDDFLQAVGVDLDIAEITNLFNQVENKQLIGMYLNLTAFYLPGSLSINRPNVSADSICMQRMEYLNSAVIPKIIELVDEQIKELQMEQRLEGRLEARIEASIEPRLESWIQARMEERLGHLLRQKLSKKFHDLIRRPVERLQSGRH